MKMKNLFAFLILALVLFSGCANTVIDTRTPEPAPETVTPVAQFHRIQDVEADTINTWYNITWDMVIPDETTNGFFTLTDNNNSIAINGFEGIVRVQGCIHPYNDYASRLEKTIRIRTLIDGVEARCLQASATKDRRANGVDIMVYSGTIAVHEGSKVQIQWMTEDTNIILQGDTVFDNPVSASVNFEKISKFNT